MDATELQVYLANTAHQREVADLQAAGLNPILSTHSTGAAVPNVMSGSGEVSARAVEAAGKANPVNRALKVAEESISTTARMALQLNKTNRELIQGLYSESSDSSTKFIGDLDRTPRAEVLNVGDTITNTALDALKKYRGPGSSVIQAIATNLQKKIPEIRSSNSSVTLRQALPFYAGR